MLKLLGAVCILGAGGWAWRRGTAERGRELDTLADLIALLDRMGEEIRLRRTSLPRLLASLGRDRGPEVRRFCASAAAGACPYQRTEPSRVSSPASWASAAASIESSRPSYVICSYIYIVTSLLSRSSPSVVTTVKAAVTTPPRPFVKVKSRTSETRSSCRSASRIRRSISGSA